MPLSHESTEPRSFFTSRHFIGSSTLGAATRQAQTRARTASSSLSAVRAHSNFQQRRSFPAPRSPVLTNFRLTREG